MAVGDVFLTTIEGRLAGQQVINNFHCVIRTGVPDEDDVHDLWTVGAVSPISTYFLALPASYTCTQMTVRNLMNPTTGKEYSDVAGNVGARTGEISGPQLAPIITWRTGLIGRSKRGRTYLPGVSESDASLGLISATLKTKMSDFATEYMATFATTTDLEACVWSPTLNDFFGITSFTIQDVLGVIRRRRVGQGK